VRYQLRHAGQLTASGPEQEHSLPGRLWHSGAVDDEALLRVIGDYFDVVPRATAKVETVGGLHVFDPAGFGAYAARPTLDREIAVTVDDIHQATARMLELKVPIFFEWVGDRAPEMATAAQEAGLRVRRYPLMVLTGAPRPVEPDDVVIEQVPDAEVARFLAVRQAVNAAFVAGGTEVGDDPDIGADDRADRARALAKRGLLVQFGAFDAETGVALGGGAHIPRPAVGATEVTGIGVLPSARRRGIGAALASAMAVHARLAGVDTVFLSAESDAVASLYGRVGFRRIGTACDAEEPDHDRQNT
jgi:ribosomal protein S18 acetylase RimI-like enzyme